MLTLLSGIAGIDSYLENLKCYFLTIMFCLLTDDSDHYYESLDIAGHQTSVELTSPSPDLQDIDHLKDIDYDSFDSDEDTDEDIKKVSDTHLVLIVKLNTNRTILGNIYKIITLLGYDATLKEDSNTLNQTPNQFCVLSEHSSQLIV